MEEQQITKEELLAQYKAQLIALKPRYMFAPTGNPKDFAIAVLNKPNFFICLMQRIILGFKYIPMEKADSYLD